MKLAGEPAALKRRLKGMLVDRKVVFMFCIYFVIQIDTVSAVSGFNQKDEINSIAKWRILRKVIFIGH